MADNENERTNESGGESTAGSGSQMASNYFAQLMNLLKRPDDFFADTYHGHKLFGLINLAALLIALVLAGFAQRASYGTVDFGDFLGGIKYALALAVPLAAVLFVYPWYAKQQGREVTLDFMLEKLGGAVALSAILILLAFLLNFIDVTLGGWFRGAGQVLIYVAVFMTAYWYVAPNRVAVATIALLAFYVLYRLVGLIL